MYRLRIVNIFLIAILGCTSVNIYAGNQIENFCEGKELVITKTHSGGSKFQCFEFNKTSSTNTRVHQTGKQIITDKNGNIIGFANIDKGELNGTWYEFSSNGLILEKKEFNHGVPCGTHISYREDRNKPKIKMYSSCVQTGG